jgi:RNA polymerase sigma-70 factor (ECF subfamily)
MKEPETLSLDVSRAYQRHRAELRTFFANVARGKAGYVDDLVQNVYLRLLEYPPMQVLREPQAYLFKLAWRELHRFHQREQREPRAYEPDLLDRLSGVTTVAAQTPDDSVEQVLIQVIGELPAIYGEVFVRFKWDGKTYKEIAAEFRLTPRQVKRYIARTLQCLKRAQQEQ